jgi:hypothetical protein
MRIQNGSVFFGIDIPLLRFKELAESHLQNAPDTLQIEDFASTMIQQDFPREQLGDFIKKVCHWGNYNGMANRILKNNDFDNIRSSFRQAVENSKTPHQDLSLALRSINQLKQLGTPSFASKHLRFLAPKFCPVYDSILRAALPYDFDAGGYARFAFDCLQLSSILKDQLIENPFRRPNNEWFAADVESALFALFYKRWLAG